MQAEKNIHLRFPGDLLYIGPIRAFIKQLARRLNFSPPRIDDIELAVEEVCNNAIEHGSSESQSDILLAITLEHNKIEVLVRDKGREPKTANWLCIGRLEQIQQEMSPEGERGHGIYLAKRLSDEMDLKPNCYGGTDVRLTFCMEKR